MNTLNTSKYYVRALADDVMEKYSVVMVSTLFAYSVYCRRYVLVFDTGVTDVEL